MTASGMSAGKPQYRKLIKAGLTPARRRGISFGSKARQATQPAYELLEQAEVMKKKGAWKAVVDISQTVLEEMVPALQFIDDSSGDVGDAIRWATHLLSEAADQPLDPSLQKSFFKWSMKSVRGNRYEGWDTQTDLTAIAVCLADNKKQVSEVETYLDERIGEIGKNRSGYSWKYDLESVVTLKISLLRNENRPEEASELMEEYRYLPRVLEKLIESAWSAGEIARVEELAQEAINTLGKAAPGLVAGWIDWLARAAEEQGDDKMQQKRLKELFYNKANLESYKRLKKATPAKYWPELFEEIVAALKKRRRSFYILPEVYEEENRLDDLLKWLKNNPDFMALDRFGIHFRESHTEEVFALYEQLIREFLTHNTGRKYYRRVVRILRELSGAGFSEQVPPLAQTFKKQYNNRPALLDELRKL